MLWLFPEALEGHNGGIMYQYIYCFTSYFPVEVTLSSNLPFLRQMKALKDLGLDVMKGTVTTENSVKQTKFFITRFKKHFCHVFSYVVAQVSFYLLCLAILYIRVPQLISYFFNGSILCSDND